MKKKKNRDYSSFILAFLTITLVLLCVALISFADDGVFSTWFFPTTDTSATDMPTYDKTTATKNSSIQHSIIIDNSTESSSHDIKTYAEHSTSDTTPDVTSSTETVTTTPIPESTTMETPAPTTATEPPTTAEPSTEAPSTAPSETTTLKEPSTADNVPINPDGKYDYSRPVPLSAPVDDDYFLDALFLGDSLTDGLALYSGLKTATFYSKQALSTSTAFTTPAVTIGEEKLSIIDAMKVTSFNKVYIMLGINEVGYPSPNSFIKKYAQIIDTVREVNPDAVIYVQSILPITANRSETHKYIKNSAIAKFDTALEELAAEKQVYYVNVAEALSDETGALISEASSDGVHLKRDYYKVWLEYLKNHVVT